MRRLSGNQGPDLLTALMNMSLVLREPRKMHLCRSLNAPRLPWLLEMLQTITFCRFLARCRIPCACHTKRHLNAQKCSERVSFWLRNVLRATTCTCWTSQLPKVVRACGALSIFTSKCASRHNGVHFLNISTSKSGPSMWCFEHFHFQMRFAPRRRAYFEHLNFQKCSDTGVFCTFWLWNVLRATTAWSQLQKVFRDRQFLTLLTSKCGSRHNCVQFFISHLARWLRTRRFSEPTFRRPNTLEKHSVSRLFYLFARLHLLSFAPFSSVGTSLVPRVFPRLCLGFFLACASDVVPNGFYVCGFYVPRIVAFQVRGCENSLTLWLPCVASKCLLLIVTGKWLLKICGLQCGFY